MSKKIIFNDYQFAKYKGRKVKLLKADSPPCGFIDSECKVVECENYPGTMILLNENVHKLESDKLLKLEREFEDLRRRLAKERRKFEGIYTDKFRPQYPFQIEV